MSLIICQHGPSVWDLLLSWWWKQDLWSLKQACCSCSLTLALLLSLSLSQGIKVKTGIKWSVKHSRLSSLCLFLSFPSTFFCLFSTFLADLYVYPTASAAGDQISVKEGWETEMDFEVKCLDEVPQSPTKGKLLQRFDLLHNFWQTYILTSWSKCHVLAWY